MFHISDDRDCKQIFCSVFLAQNYASYFCKVPLESLEHADYKAFLLTMAKRNLREGVLNDINCAKLSLVFVNMDSPDFDLYTVFLTSHCGPECEILF
jgi:hypothetical protein